jgi:hypothetical protein
LVTIIAFVKIPRTIFKVLNFNLLFLNNIVFKFFVLSSIIREWYILFAKKVFFPNLSLEKYWVTLYWGLYGI